MPMKTIEHFVNGKKFTGAAKRTSKIFNPATGEETAKVKLGSEEDLKKTVEKAKVRKVAQILVTIKALAFSAMKILLPNFMAILVLVTCLLKKVNFHML